ncbi:hypothetical protein ABZ436_24210 [Micromonospora matsumotoense]|uniref:hypothetical protein n=1 Tax=Micromonospora matsumotoense TaxID=121616 RepID=UPI00340E60FB
MRKYVDAGFDHLVLQNAGPDPDGFIDFYRDILAARLRSLSSWIDHDERERPASPPTPRLTARRATAGVQRGRRLRIRLLSRYPPVHQG